MNRLHEAKIDDAAYYERVWSTEYDTKPYYDAVRQRALLKYVERGNRVVDLGAGCFGAVQYLAQNFPELSDCKLYAVDQSWTAKDLVLQADYRPGTKLFNNPNFHYILSDADNTPLRDGWFDCVISGELIEHFEDPMDLVREMVRLCKPGGWITLSTVDTNCPNAKAHGDYPEHIWEFDPEDLVGFFKDFGKAKHSFVGDYHFVEVQKP